MPDVGDLSLYADITRAFANARSSNGCIEGAKLGQAAKMIAPLYDRIFGHGMVANHLKNDILGHGNGLIDAVEEDRVRYRFVEDMVPAMVKERGIENIRGKWGEGVLECLWTKRALDFILRFLEYGILTHTDLSLHECASKAYQEVLKPYHGIMVSTVVTLAFNLAPRRQNFLTALGFTDLKSAQESLTKFVAVAKPIIAQVHEILEKNGCDFSDKSMALEDSNCTKVLCRLVEDVQSTINDLLHEFANMAQEVGQTANDLKAISQQEVVRGRIMSAEFADFRQRLTAVLEVLES